MTAAQTFSQSLVPIAPLPGHIIHALKALGAQEPNTMNRKLQTFLSPAKTASALASLRAQIGGDQLAAVHVVSAYQNEGAARVGFELAYTASQNGKRVLFLDTAETARSFLWGSAASKQTILAQPLSLDHFISGGIHDSSPFYVFEETSLVCASLPSSSAFLAESSLCHALIKRLKELFAFIVIVSDSVLLTSAVSTFSPQTDGTIIVAQAERNRIPVIKELMQRVQSSKAKIVGTILTQRRKYIPSFLYALLYTRHRY